MALSNEDKKDVSRAFGKKAASAVSNATQDSKSKAIHAKMGKKGPVKIQLGQKAKDNFSYTVSDHKGTVLRKGGWND